jgi:hypothetical protein
MYAAGEHFEWIRLGVNAGICFNAVPSRCSFAAGRWDSTMEVPNKKERAKREPRVINNAKEQEPEQVSDKEDVASSLQSHSVAKASITHLRKELKRQIHEANVCYRNENNGETSAIDGIEFLLDKNSFPKTVENMFYYSFLVKRGTASVKVNSTGLGARHRFELGIPAVQDCEESETPATQSVCALTMRDWRRLRAAYTDDSS